MTSDFLDDLFRTLEQKKLAIILRALLDRYPILVCSDRGTSDRLVENLATLMHHRREIVYGTDFVTRSEHERLIAHEQSDYNVERLIYRAPTSSAATILTEKIRNFSGWVIATDYASFDDICAIVQSDTKCTVILKGEEEKLSLHLQGDGGRISDTSFERKLLDRVMSDTYVKIERITRVLKHAAHGKVSNRLEQSLIDFHMEEERIRRSLFREQIYAFVHAAWRTLIILSRLRLLREIGVETSISDKTLSQAIDYTGAPIRRLLDFIEAEWGENFHETIRKGRVRSFCDRIEGFWTV